MSENKIARLVNIKALYESALEHLQNPTPLDAAIALVLMDNALEAAFKLALDEENAKSLDGNVSNFYALLSDVLQIDELKELEAHKQALKVLRGARNGFQHQGIIPDTALILNQYKPLTQHMLEIIAKKKFGIEWKEISLSLIVKNETIRWFIRSSEESFVKQDYAESAAFIIYSFEVVKMVANLCIFGSGLFYKRLNAKLKCKSDDPLFEYISKLDEEIEVLKFGLDYSDYRNYLDVARNVEIASIFDTIPTDKGLDENMACFKEQLSNSCADKEGLKQWCIKMKDFVLRFAVRTESNERVGAIVAFAFFEALMQGLKEGSMGKSSIEELR